RLPVLVTARSSIDSLNFATVRGSVAARQKPRHVPLFPLGLLLLYSCRRCVGALLAQSRTIANRPMTADQAATLKRLAEAAYELDAFKPNLTRDEADLRIAMLIAKLKLLDEPPHTL